VLILLSGSIKMLECALSPLCLTFACNVIHAEPRHFVVCTASDIALYAFSGVLSPSALFLYQVKF
jgi:hypothetical protein